MIIVFILSWLGAKAQQTKEEKADKYIFATNQQGVVPKIEIHFNKGPAFYYPLMAIWIEDMNGNYLQTLYVAESIAIGVFNYGEIKNSRWVNGERGEFIS
jgi:hypothetical protein